jgi:ubiquinone biosynthesis protein COQ4
MTAITADKTLDHYGRPLQPMRAWRAFRKLIADKEDTAQVFEIMQALIGRSVPRGYERLVRTPGGGELAWRREELAKVFDDRTWLASLAPDSVGAAYRAFMAEEDLSAEGLAAENRRVTPEIDADHPYAWYGRRVRDVHDVWHVLTGYGRDALGEACVVAFSYAQTGMLGFGFIGLGAAFEIAREAPEVPARRAVLEAYANGRRAAWLPAEDYRALFAERLGDARRRLKIRRPSYYESVPDAVRRGLKLRAA